MSFIEIQIAEYLPYTHMTIPVRQPVIVHYLLVRDKCFLYSTLSVMAS